MLDNPAPLAERRRLQQEYGATTLPYQDLCYCTWTDERGEEKLVDLLGTDEQEIWAILSDGEGANRRIWPARRDQSGQPGTWLWTLKQLSEAKQNPRRIDDSENEFKNDEADNRPIKVTPLYADRRTEILYLGLRLQKTDEEVKERLRAEGLRDVLPIGYRSGWEPERQSERETEPAMYHEIPNLKPKEEARKHILKFPGKKKRR